MKNKNTIFLVIISLFLGFLCGFVVFSQINKSNLTDEEKEMKAFYANTTSTLVSPHHLRKELDKGGEMDFVLVDVRTNEEYKEEHVISAINIDSNRSSEKVLEDFKKLKEETDKEIIIYCYSDACMNGKKVGNLLAENNIFVKELSIGWNEWRYDFNSWNYPNEWDNLDWKNYVYKGEEAGVPEQRKYEGICKIDSELAC